MLVTLKKCLDAVCKNNSSAKEIGNIKTERDEKYNEVIYVYHYKKLVCIIEEKAQRIFKHPKWWNYSRSTTRLCNDLLKYFEGYVVMVL